MSAKVRLIFGLSVFYATSVRFKAKYTLFSDDRSSPLPLFSVKGDGVSGRIKRTAFQSGIC
jgi:hypothetical protein